MQATLLPSNQDTQQGINIPTVEYWKQYIRSIMVPLLRGAGSYTPAEQDAHLQFMDELIAPNLGPLPTERHAPYTPPASLVGSPFDPSLNMAASGKAKVRFDFDIVGPAQRTGLDPFAEHAAKEMALHIASKTGANTQWMKKLISAIFLSPEETQLAVARMPADNDVPPLSIGFDFEGGERLMKIYLPAVRKAVATGGFTREILLQAARSLKPVGDGLTPGLDLLEEYVNSSCSHSSSLQPIYSYLKSNQSDAKLMLLGIDCLDPVAHPETRVKCYLHTPSNAFDVARDVLTLGGRLDDETARTRIELLRPIWSFLRNERDDTPMDDNWSKPDRIKQTAYFGLMFTIEITPGQAIPDTKVYVPVAQYGESTEEIERNLELMLQKLGNVWGLTGRYRETMQSIL